MLLTALWSGKCRSINNVPIQHPPYPFALTVLEQDSLPLGRIRVMFAGDDQALDLPLGDALCDILDLELPDDAIIATVNPQEPLAADFALRLSAEILHALLARHPSGISDASLFDWAFRSLTLTKTQGDPQPEPYQVERIIAAILGFPLDRGEGNLSFYLQWIDPQYTPRPLDHGLRARLAETLNLSDWYAELWCSYLAAQNFNNGCKITF